MRIIAALMCALAVLAAFPAQAGDACGPGHLRKLEVRRNTLELRWEGSIAQQMAADIAAEFDRHKRHVSKVSLSLHSCGGAMHDMQRTIAMLEQIKATHELATVVDRGDLCGSACVPIFLTGTRRVAALTSSFFFHPVVVRKEDPGMPDTGLRSQQTDEVIRRYFAQPGVSNDWIQFLRRTLRTHDLWQSGRDLWESNSGMLTEMLDNLAPREDGPIDLPNEIACGVLCRG